MVIRVTNLDKVFRQAAWKSVRNWVDLTILSSDRWALKTLK